jgi:N-acetylmuramoyl-L-alanine amidase
MRTMLQCRMIGLMSLCALAALGASYRAGPGTSTLLAQVRERDAARSPAPTSTSGSRLASDKISDPAQEAGLPERARVTSVRLFSSKNYTRVMMELSSEVRYQAHSLKEDPSKGLPPRIYIDLLNAKLALDSKEPITVADGPLRQVRVGQFTPDVVRVVIDMTTLKEHSTFLLTDPYRLVIDVQGQKSGERVAAEDKTRERTVMVAGKSNPPPNIGVRKIVLDPGHGGKDPGAIGVGGIAEKDIVLAVAKKLAKKLKEEMGVQVVLTRTDDRFIPLEERTAIANAEEADLFVSLHMNASPNGEAKGLETYYLDNTTDEASLRLAARENSTSRKNVSDLQFILSDLTQNMKLEDSITLAHRLHRSLVDSMSKRLNDVKDLGVKKALFYVLVGARMPSVLVEMLFITNKTEGRAMSQESYQNTVVDALYDGIVKYKNSIVATKTL